MSIENSLERIADALEALAAQGKDTEIVATVHDEVAVAVPETPAPVSKKKSSKKRSKKKTGKKAKPEPTAVAPEPVTTPPFEPIPGAEVIPAQPQGMTLETLTAEIGNIARQLGPRAAEIGTYLYGQYKVQRISDLDPTYYEQFLNECKGMLPQPAA